MSADWASFRKLFPVTERYAYLNNAGVAPLSSPATDAVSAWAEEMSLHGAMRYKRMLDGLDGARQSFASLIGAGKDEIAFVANTSDGLSLVANGLAWKKGDRVLVPDHEFPANVYPWLALERQGVEVKRIPYVEGRCTPEQIEKFLPGARLLSLSAVSYANGYRFDLVRIGELCRQHGVLFCVDGIQGAGMIPLDVGKAQIDFLSADGHKWLVAPEGAGCFFVARDRLAELTPSKIGWRNFTDDMNFSNIDFTYKSSAEKLEEGTPNVSGMLALGASIDALMTVGMDQIANRIKTLTDHLVEELGKAGYKVRSPRTGADWSGIVSFIGDGDDAKRLAAAARDNIMLAFRDGALRASPHAYNDESDIERLMAVLAAHRPQ